MTRFNKKHLLGVSAFALVGLMSQSAQAVDYGSATTLAGDQTAVQNFTADVELTLNDGVDFSGADPVVTNSVGATNKGDLTLEGAHSFTGAIGASGTTIGDISIEGVSGKTVAFDGDVFADLIQYTGTADASITLTDGTDITATNGITINTDGNGDLTTAGTTTITGAVGVTGKRIGTITANGGSGKTLTLANDVFADNFSIGGAGTIAIADDADLAVTSGITTTSADQGTITFAGTTTVTANVGVTGTRIGTINADGASETVTFDGDVFSKAFNFGADGTVALADGHDLTVTDGITTTTTNTGTLTVNTTGAGAKVDGNIGVSGTLLKEVKIAAGTNGTEFTGNIYATDLDFNNVAETITLSGTDSTIGGTITSGGDGVGTLTFSAATDNDAVITGSIGTDASNDLGVLNFDAGDADSSLTLNGASNFVAQTNFEKGALNINGDLTGNVVFTAGATGTVTVATGETVTGNFTTASGDEGTITLSGSAGITGNVGAIGTRVNALNIGTGTVAATNVGVNTTTFTGDGTITIANGGEIEGAVAVSTTNTGTITFAQGGNIDAGLGASGKVLKKVNIGGTTQGTVVVQNGDDILATEVELQNDSTLQLASTSDITGNITTDTNTNGVLDIDGGTTITGSIGASGKELKSIDIAAVTANTTESIYAEVINFSGDGTLSVAAGKNIVSSDTAGAVITAGTDDDGTVTFAGNTTVAGQIGADATTQIGTVNFNGGTGTVNAAIFADTVNIATGANLTVGAAATHDADIAVAGTGTLNLGSVTTTLNGAGDANAGNVTYAGTAGNLGVTVTGTDSADSGRITAAGTVDLNNGTDITVNVSSNELIADGSTYAIITAGTLSNAGSVTYSDNSYTLDFKTSSATGTVLTIEADRVNTLQSSSSNANESAVGSALESIANTGDSDLDSVVAALDGLSSAGAVEAALETLTPEVNGITAGAVADATAGAQGTVSTRVASLRGNAAGIATGADFRDTAAWGEFFGGSADQADRDNVRGYQADIYGGSIGVDAEIANNLVLGIAGSYSTTDADSARGSAEAETFQGTLYGSYSENGNWYDAQLAVGFTDYETSRNISVGSISDTAKGDFDGINYAAKFEVGRDIKVQGPLQFTPRAGFEYTLITQDSYTETGSSANLTVDNDDIQKLDLGVGFDLSYPLVANGVSYLPELRFGYKYDVIGDEVEATSKFTSASTTFKSEGADVAESTFEFGAGIDILAQDNLTVSFDYDTTQREDYEAHIGSVKARFAF